MARFSQIIGALRLLQSTGRGLSEALPLLRESSGRSQPWMLSSIQAYSTNASTPTQTEFPSNPSSSSSNESLNRIDTPDTAAVAASSSSQQQQNAAKVPVGHVDFTKRQLVMMYTCGQCEVRSAKAFSKMAYTSGVVIVECPGCGARHLIADHLGWFGSKGTVEEFAEERGNTVVTKLADNTLELCPEDVVGSAAHAAAVEAGEQLRSSSSS